MPAIYYGERMRPFREWLKEDSFEAIASLGGSFYSDNIKDYYFTPWDLDYGRLIKFDHDFVGREALQRMSGATHRKKVTLEWNAQDVLSVYGSLLHDEPSDKYIETPTAHYATLPFDKILSHGRMVGVRQLTSRMHPTVVGGSLGRRLGSAHGRCPGHAPWQRFYL